MRCDLHVHTRASGMCTVPVLNRVCRESYSQPHDVYETLKRRGMDLVTVTDHDSIDAGDALLPFADFFLSEEVSCVTPAGTRIHVGVYDIQERHHFEIQRRSGDLLSLLHYLDEQRLFYTINHAFSWLTGPRVDDDFRLFAERFPGMETRNGQMLPESNALSQAFAHRYRKAQVGGSDGHTLASLGRTYTEVPGARSKREFLAGLRAGRGRIRGESGDYWKLTRAVAGIGTSLVRERRWTVLLTPLLAFVPLAIGLNCVGEWVFARKWRHVAAPLETGLFGAVPDEAAVDVL